MGTHLARLLGLLGVLAWGLAPLSPDLGAQKMAKYGKITLKYSHTIPDLSPKGGRGFVGKLMMRAIQRTRFRDI